MCPHKYTVTLGNCQALVYNIKRFNYDIICLAETWLSPAIALPPLLGYILTMYDSIRCDRMNKIGGGILFLIKSIFTPAVVY